MIHDSLDHAERYRHLGPRFTRAFDYLRSLDVARQPDGQVDLVPGELWALILRRPARKAETAQLEYHRRFADLQYCHEGAEQVGWNPTADGLSEAKPYDAEKDAGLLQGPITHFLPLGARRFAVFFPGELHAPLIGDGPLTKVVLKILIA